MVWPWPKEGTAALGLSVELCLAHARSFRTVPAFARTRP